jgi:arabinogalactan endo-1,4-beta-galactosidase
MGLHLEGPTSTNGSSWENQAWDFNNNSLPVMDVFNYRLIMKKK